VSPRRIAGRGKDRMRRRFQSAKEKVMGSENGDQHQIEDQIKGNPLAAGLIAAGVGALVASLLPGDRTSREAAQALSDRAGPMVDQAKSEAKQVGQAVGENVGQHAKESAQHLQDQAKESAEHVKGEAKSSGERVKDESRSASENVKDETRRQM
jgi:gas vesicle protein